MGRKSRFSREQWGRLVAEQSASGLSAVKFCKQRKLRLPTFYQWRRRLAAEADVSIASDTLVPLQVVGDDRIDVELNCGATIKLPVADKTATREILKLLVELGHEG